MVSPSCGASRLTLGSYYENSGSVKLWGPPQQSWGVSCVALELPVLLPREESDPILAPGRDRLRGIFKNVAPPIAIEGGGHFIQEDAGEELAGHIRKWMTH